MKHNIKRGLMLLSTMLLVLFLLAACGDSDESASRNDSNNNNNTEEQNDSNVEDVGEPTQISMMATLHTPEVPDDKVLKEIERAANVKFDIEWVPDNTYEDKLNTAFATETLPQI